MHNFYINRSCTLNLIFKKKRITRCIWSPFKIISHNHYEPFLIQHPTTPMIPFSFNTPQPLWSLFHFNTLQPLWSLSHSTPYNPYDPFLISTPYNPYDPFLISPPMVWHIKYNVHIQEYMYQYTSGARVAQWVR